MKNETFVFKIKRDSIPEPEDFSMRKLSVFDFFTSIHSFISHNFAGAIKINFPERYKGFIHISPRGFAYFISLLLSDIYGNSMVNVDVLSDDEKIIMHIDGIGALKRKNRLFDIAVRSGFSVTEENDRLILSAPVKITQESFVYADNMLELINYFYEVFLS